MCRSNFYFLSSVSLQAQGSNETARSYIVVSTDVSTSSWLYWEAGGLFAEVLFSLGKLKCWLVNHEEIDIQEPFRQQVLPHVTVGNFASTVQTHVFKSRSRLTIPHERLRRFCISTIVRPGWEVIDDATFSSTNHNVWIAICSLMKLYATRWMRTYISGEKLVCF